MRRCCRSPGAPRKSSRPPAKIDNRPESEDRSRRGRIKPLRPSRDAVGSGNKTSRRPHHYEERVLTKMLRGGRVAPVWATRVVPLLVLAAVANGGAPPLSFAPVVNVSLGPPSCTADVDCSSGALGTAAGGVTGD